MASVSELLHAIDLADQALAMVDVALNNNPSPDEERSLRRQRLRLEAERRALEAELDAALDRGSVADGPTAPQMSAIMALVDDVERATHQRESTSRVLSLASQTLSVISEVTSD